jgi:hypothetical protein
MGARSLDAGAVTAVVVAVHDLGGKLLLSPTITMAHETILSLKGGHNLLPVADQEAGHSHRGDTPDLVLLHLHINQQRMAHSSIITSKTHGITTMDPLHGPQIRSASSGFLSHPAQLLKQLKLTI